MMRSRSRSPESRSRQPNFQRSRSRSPFYRDKQRRFDNKPYRGHFHQHAPRFDDRRRREDFHYNSSPRRSPGFYKSHSQDANHHETQGGMLRKNDFQSQYPGHRRSPVTYANDGYRRRSPTPQRLTTAEPNPKQANIFRGPEGTIIDLNELKKITVDIRRNIPRGSAPVSHGPLRYAFNASDFVLVRRPGEGSRPLFDREDLRPRPAEERVIKLAPDPMPERLERQSPPRLRDSYAGASGFQQEKPLLDSRSVDGDSEGDLRLRLMEKKNEEIKERMNADPNFVPQGRYYYEHDNREKFNRGRGYGYRGNGRGTHHNTHHQTGNSRGSFRGGFNHQGQSRDFHFRGSYRGNSQSLDWKHDLYETVSGADDGKPSSTTQI